MLLHLPLAGEAAAGEVISGLSLHVSIIVLGLLDGDSLNLPLVRLAVGSPWPAPSLQKYREVPREREAKARKWSLDPPSCCGTGKSVMCTEDLSLLL